MDKIIQKLKDKNYRITNSRIALIKVFYKNPKKHFTTDEVIEVLETNEEKVNVMSLYNNLKILIEEKIIQESVFKGKKVYEITTGYHMHFYCKKCNKHIDMDFEENFTNLKKFEKQYGILIEGAKIEYNGLCSDCKESV